MEIIVTPDPRLRLVSKKVSKITDETKKHIDLMIKNSLERETEHPFELSAAMAAPQLGINERIIIIRDNMEDKDDQAFVALINPEVIKTKTIDGTEVRIKAEGSLARTLLHEIDHLDGVLFIDHIKDQPDAWFELDDKGEITPVDYLARVKNNPDLFPDEA